MEMRRTDVVRTTRGDLTGLLTEDDIGIYLGIPYAKVPAGERRFLPAVLPDRWEGVRHCDSYGASPMQNELDHSLDRLWTKEFIVSVEDFSEDSLTANIWAPVHGKNMPVVVYCYGGGFTIGGSSCEIYDGSAFARQGIIYVSFNHREGTLGTLALEELEEMNPDHRSGNQILSDEICLLQWIHENIAAFGGDPENVTIWGQSSGAIEVQYLLTSPLTQNLFSKAVIMGFVAYAEEMFMIRELRHEAGLLKGREILDAFGGTLEELMQCPARRILELPAYGRLTIGGYAIDTDFRSAILAGAGKDKPVLIGTVPGDALMVPMSRIHGNDQLEKFRTLMPQSLPAFEKIYGLPADDPGVWDDALRCMLLQFGEARNQIQAAPTYLYHFSYVMPGPDSALFGAFHSCEVPYFHDHFSDFRKDYWKEEDYALGGYANELISGFIKTGVPSDPAFKATDGNSLFHISGSAHNDMESMEPQKKQLWKDIVAELAAAEVK